MDERAVRVALVEDNPGDQMLVTDHLRRGGLAHQLSIHGTLRAAIEASTDGPRPDVVLLDMQLPDGEGLAALDRVARAWPGVPIVVLTGREDDTLSRACLESGASDYLQKDELGRRALIRSIEYAVLRCRAVTLRTQLEHAGRLVSIGEIAAGVAHEINNPAAYVLANVSEMEHCLRSQAGGCVMQSHLAAIRDGVERIVRVSADLLRFARTTDEAHDRSMDVNELCAHSVTMVRNRLRHMARLETDFRASQPISGDPVRFGQVLVNLLVNAANAVEEAGDGDHLVRIGTRDAQSHVEITVSDTGGGIAPQVRERLFEPFFTTRTDRGGTGLGLSICREIVASSGGSIDFDSTVGEGTVFRVRLPASTDTASPSPQSDRTQVAAQRSKLRVLLIDDEEQLRRALSMVVSRHHDVTAVGSARAALELVAHDREFDAIVCDLMMPDMDGIGFVRALGEQAPGLVARTGILTGGATTPDARAYLERCSVPVLAKPATARQLMDFIGRLAGRATSRIGPEALADASGQGQGPRREIPV